VGKQTMITEVDKLGETTRSSEVSEAGAVWTNMGKTPTAPSLLVYWDLVLNRDVAVWGHFVNWRHFTASNSSSSSSSSSSSNNEFERTQKDSYVTHFKVLAQNLTWETVISHR
jgi:hypothetical protein